MIGHQESAVRPESAEGLPFCLALSLPLGGHNFSRLEAQAIVDAHLDERQQAKHFVVACRVEVAEGRLIIRGKNSPVFRETLTLRFLPDLAEFAGYTFCQSVVQVNCGGTAWPHFLKWRERHPHYFKD